MNISKLVIVLAAILLGVSAHAQSVSTVFQSDIYNGWAHRIYPNSLTCQFDVDRGGQASLRRTVDIDQFGVWTDASEVNSLNHVINVNGVDSFEVCFPNMNSWYARVHYRYTVDPDGNGPLHNNDDAVPVVEIGPIHPKPAPNPMITEMQIDHDLHYLNLTFETGRYVEIGTPYDAEYVLEVVNTDLNTVAYYDSVSINPAGSPTMYKEYHDEIYLTDPGWYCVRVRIRFSHDGPGYSDFTGILVAQTNGNNCEYFEGISTSVSQQPDTKPCQLRVWPNPATDQMTVEGFDPSQSFEIVNVDGQVVQVVPASSTVNVSELASGGYLMRQAHDGRACRFVKVTP
jgi:hypothetical protein